MQSLTPNSSTGDSQKRRLLAPCRRGTATIARKTALKTRYSGQGTIGPATNKALLLESIWPPHKAPDLFILIKWTFFALRLVFYWADILYPGTFPLSPPVLLALVLNSDWTIKQENLLKPVVNVLAIMSLKTLLVLFGLRKLRNKCRIGF